MSSYHFFSLERIIVLLISALYISSGQQQVKDKLYNQTWMTQLKNTKPATQLTRMEKWGSKRNENNGGRGNERRGDCGKQITGQNMR